MGQLLQNKATQTCLFGTVAGKMHSSPTCYDSQPWLVPPRDTHNR